MNMMKFADSKGFSLIEVLIAITLLSIGLLGVASMQGTAISANSFARSGTEAIQLAEEMVDRIRSNAGNDPILYDNIDTGGTCTGSDPALADCTAWKAILESSGLQNISGTVDVQNDTPLAKTATITVTVEWGPNGDDRNVTFTTILETWGT